MNRIQIKPLSVNEVWKGRRYRTDKYKDWSEHLGWILPNDVQTFPKMYVEIVFAFSNAGSDIDNPLKPFIDVLQKRYKFNDAQIYSLHVEKTVVPKGAEYVGFKFYDYDETK